VACSDAVFSNLRADSAERLGLRYERLRSFNARIVCANLSAFGRGSRAHEPGYDYVLQGETGWMSITGEPGGPPTKSGLSLADYTGGIVAALAMLAAIHAARRTGEGGDCDLSLYDAAISMLSYPAAWYLNGGLEPTRTRHSSHPSIVPFGVFRAADGWLVVACAKQHFWRSLVAALGRRELDDERFADMDLRRVHREELTSLLDGIFCEQPVARWLTVLRDRGVPCGPVRSVAEALDDPFCAERNMLVEVEHPHYGTMRLPATAVRDARAASTSRPAPACGQDTATVLRELLEVSERTYDAWKALGAFGS
jgi:crotonobetainyl-CoA:carnitine CoA-transferase CaiB-like acyl-CoA transferase